MERSIHLTTYLDGLADFRVGVGIRRRDSYLTFPPEAGPAC
jgi:hypothetical protein